MQKLAKIFWIFMVDDHLDSSENIMQMIIIHGSFFKMQEDHPTCKFPWWPAAWGQKPHEVGM